MRNQELTNAANFTNLSLRAAVSLNMWGGVTFDVAMRFLQEFPWKRLETLREKVPGVPFQILLYGATIMIYTNYSDKLVHRFCKQASKSDVGVFHLFDYLNYIENLNINVDADSSAGMFMKGNLSCTGDVFNPNKGKYDIEYYINLIRDLSDMGFHSLAIKDMEGILTPHTATMFVSTLREDIHDMPLHIHTNKITGGAVYQSIVPIQAAHTWTNSWYLRIFPWRTYLIG